MCIVFDPNNVIISINAKHHFTVINDREARVRRRYSEFKNLTKHKKNSKLVINLLVFINSHFLSPYDYLNLLL